ncbi:NAD(P)-dependent alcohol dehydrogenase [Flavobacterium sp. 3HN19-14]|uniref:NAD(P)-dependent alcohol dehydrogenase n=1 Tax=Flavobacterium sp. 3HN19-14 TaxID=3448133 RepID=UPI003EE3852E
MQTFKILAYGATGSLIGGKTLNEMEIERNTPVDDEILIDILYCGVCHSDIHQVNNDWENTIYPCVPGHEIIGRVAGLGSEATKYQIGEIVGVGCMIDSCTHCRQCHEGEEQFCEGHGGPTMTYNGYKVPDGTDFNTFGGYSTQITVKEHFVLRIPENLDTSRVAPLLCAGVTTFSPLKRANIKKGDRVGIIGIGGLGHVAVKIAKAMGAEVTAITTKEDKREPLLQIGADRVLLSDYDDSMKQHELYFDFLLCTIPYPFDINLYVPLLKVRGELITVGLLGPYKKPLDNNEVAMSARKVGGSLIGGIAETQETLDFCSTHHILPEVQMISIDQINDAYDKIKEEDVRFRYVIDMQSLREKENQQ